MFMQRLSKKEKTHKILIITLLMGICSIQTVDALGVGPTHIDITVDKGSEIEVIRSIQLINSETNPIHITGSVIGPIGQFINLEPNEFDLPAGPGAMSTDPRPYQYVRAVIRVPRELPENLYNGEIVFTQSPVEGGVLGASAQIGVRVTLTIGKMTEAFFPTYINAMIFLLLILLALSVILTVRRKRKKDEKD